MLTSFKMLSIIFKSWTRKPPVSLAAILFEWKHTCTHNTGSQMHEKHRKPAPFAWPQSTSFQQTSSKKFDYFNSEYFAKYLIKFTMFYHVSILVIQGNVFEYFRCEMIFLICYSKTIFLQISLEHEILLHPRYFGPNLLNTVKQKLFTEVEGTCSGK